MKRWTVFALLLAALFTALSLVVITPIAASPVGDGIYCETFTTTAYVDAAHTTAVWDTALGQLRLHAPVPCSQAVAGQLHHATAWSPAVYVPSTGRVYLFGGLAEPNAIQEYDPATHSTVESGLILPYPLCGAAAVYMESRNAVHLLGGGPHTDVIVFDVGQAVTRTLANVLPAPLSYASAVYVPSRDKAYIFGGRGADGSELNTILEYDPAAGTVVTLPVSLPISMSMSSAIYDPVTDSAYIFGGQFAGFPLASIVKFDVATQAVTTAGTGTLPVPCSSSCAVYVPEQHRAYIFGGLGQTWPLSQTIEYDIGSGTATSLSANLPSERSGAAAVYVSSSSTIYILGGEQILPIFSDIIAFDVNTHNIKDMSARVDGKDGASAIYAPDAHKAYIFGGRCGDEAVSQSILAYDVNQVMMDTLRATLPVSRTDTAAIYDPTLHQAYIFGGWWPDDSAQYFNDILRFDVAAETVMPASAVLPSGRAGVAAAYVPARGRAYLFGGVGGSGCLDEILAYDPAQDTLTTLSVRLPMPVAYAAAVYDALTDKVYLLGGWNPNLMPPYLDQIVAFDVNSETVTLLTAKLPLFRAKAAAIAIPSEGRIYVIGGTYGSGCNLNDIVSFDTATGTVTTVQDVQLSVGRSAAQAVYVPQKTTAYLFGGIGYRADLPLDDIIALKFTYPLSETAQSLMVNATAEQVHQALLAAEQALHGGSVAYSLSNDGGQTWVDVQPGVKHIFASPGSDLRWRAVLSGNGETTPIVDSLTIMYDGINELFLPVVLKVCG